MLIPTYWYRQMGKFLMTYKEFLIDKMAALAKDSRIYFIGYNTAYGHRFNGTLSRVNPAKCIETPVAENLIMGLAMGMALEGYRPIVCVERMDFLWACADAIVNHLDKSKQLGWPSLNVLIRTCVGSSSPLNPGCQHQGDYYGIWKQLLKEVDVRHARTPADLRECYMGVRSHEGPIMIVEYRDMYDVPPLPTVSSKAASIK